MVFSVAQVLSVKRCQLLTSTWLAAWALDQFWQYVLFPVMHKLQEIINDWGFEGNTLKSSPVIYLYIFIIMNYITSVSWVFIIESASTLVLYTQIQYILAHQQPAVTWFGPYVFGEKTKLHRHKE